MSYKEMKSKCCQRAKNTSSEFGNCIEATTQTTPHAQGLHVRLVHNEMSKIAKTEVSVWTAQWELIIVASFYYKSTHYYKSFDYDCILCSVITG